WALKALRALSPCPLRQQKAPSSGASRSCGARIRTLTTRSRAGRPTVRRPRRARNSVAASDFQAVKRAQALLGFGVDVRGHLDVRLEARADELRLQQGVDLVD